MDRIGRMERTAFRILFFLSIPVERRRRPYLPSPLPHRQCMLPWMRAAAGATIGGDSMKKSTGRKRVSLCALLVRLTISAALVVVLPAARPVLGIMMGHETFVLDFTKPEEVKSKATWSDPDKLDVTPAGLGWDGDPRGSRDAWIESVPVAVGFSWRPVISVSVTAEVLPPGKFIFRENQTIWPGGEIYARYSPDRKHWSSWHCLEMQPPRNKRGPRQTYKGTVRVPYREAKAYRALIRKYVRMDVPWGSDEEAAVRWILEDDPRFFEKQLPFVGYVQFLYETVMRGGKRLKGLRFELHFGAGGAHMPARDPAVEKGHGGPWRFVAQ
jgi:hypothetical protein